MDDEVIKPGVGLLAEVDVAGLTEDGAARTFEYEDRLGQQSEGFVMRWKDGFVAYENRCPHWSIPLGWDDENFLGRDHKSILCPMHGARFDPETGHCWEGPCLGDTLDKFEVDVDGDVASIRRVKRRFNLL